MTSPLTFLVRDILSDGRTRELAARAIKGRVDWIYGHSKYDLVEVSGELRDRLHSMEYLGVAVGDILEGDGLDEDVKTVVARNYMQVIPLYAEGSLPKNVYEMWEGMEPMCVVETANFLEKRGLFDWRESKLLECVLRFASGSSVGAKRDFLSSLIGRMNKDKHFLVRFSTRMMSPQEMAYREMEALTGKKNQRDPYGLDEIPEARRNLLVNLQPLLDADGGESSFAPLAGLEVLTDHDIIEFFLGVGGLFFFSGRMNRTVLFSDLAEGMLTSRGIRPIDVLMKLDQRTNRDKFFYGDEAKAKGLMHLVKTAGEPAQEFARIIQKFIGYKMETDTRFRFLKFVYGQTSDRSILETALSFKSHVIRDWASKEMDELTSR